MSTDNYASEEETRALIVPDTRTPAEKRLHKLIEAESVPELCGSDYPDALYKVAVKLAGQTTQPQQEPFGYFKAEPFGWTDCAATDEGAVALYEHPPAQSKPLPNDLRLAIESMIETHEAGDLDGWEVELVERKLRICAHNIKESK